MPHINKNIFRAYDIRGIALAANDTTTPLDLTPETVFIISRAIGEYFIEHGAKKIVVGRDNRLTSESLQRACIQGLQKSGCTITNIGLATSPMMYWATCAMNFDGGINITASHNPKEYNGIKIVGGGAHAICGDELQIIYTRANELANNEAEIITADDLAQSIPKETPIADEYIQDLLARTHLSRPLTVVIDAGNATPGAFAPKLFGRFGCNVTPLYCDLDGTYPHHEANPEEAKNMIDLAAKVKEIGADLGIAFDGDGDRVGIVDELGRHHSADYLLLLLAQDLMTRMPGAQVVFDVKVSQLLISGIREAGGVPVMCKTGHSFIEAKMQEIKAPLGGEISGHFFFGENYYGFDDAFFAALKLAEIFSQSETKVSARFDALPATCTTPEYKLPCADDRKFAVVQAITDHFTKIYSCITIDGVRINFDTQSWGAIRCSNTSPNLTARFEAPTPQRLEEIKMIMLEQLKQFPEVNTTPLSE